jgi:hypothetical protein
LKFLFDQNPNYCKNLNSSGGLKSESHLATLLDTFAHTFLHTLLTTFTHTTVG